MPIIDEVIKELEKIKAQHGGRGKAMEKWKVEVVEDATGKVVKIFETNSKRHAEQIERVVRINMDHEKFDTRVVKA